MSNGIKVPKKCLICGARWSGGHAKPRGEMKDGLRVFYACGASMSATESEIIGGVFHILFKNCCTEEVKNERRKE